MTAVPNETAAVRVEGLWKSFAGHEVLRESTWRSRPGRSSSSSAGLDLASPRFSGASTSSRSRPRGRSRSRGSGLEGGHRTRAKRERIRQVRIRTGMVFQDFNLFPHRTALQNVTEGPVTVLGKSARDAEATARELLEMVGLPEKADQYPIQLSGGQHHRARRARRRPESCRGHRRHRGRRRPDRSGQSRRSRPRRRPAGRSGRGARRRPPRPCSRTAAARRRA